MFRASLLIFSALSITACTQPPSNVAMRGHESFDRGNESSYASASYYNNLSPAAGGQNAAPITYRDSGYTTTAAPIYQAPVSQATQQTASLNSVTVTDLAPPAKTSAPAATTQAAAPTNPWTGKPREMEVVLKQPTQDAGWSAKPTQEQQAYIWPVSSKKVVSSFGPKGSGKANDGINIASSEGEPVWAAADGEVVYVDNALKGYGNMVLVKHSGGKTSSYAHLSRASVAKYDRVKQGDIIGYVGATGNVKSPQLYFSMRQGTEAVDPQKIIGTSVAGL